MLGVSSKVMCYQQYKKVLNQIPYEIEIISIQIIIFEWVWNFIPWMSFLYCMKLTKENEYLLNSAVKFYVPSVWHNDFQFLFLFLITYAITQSFWLRFKINSYIALDSAFCFKHFIYGQYHWHGFILW